jgi:integrase
MKLTNTTIKSMAYEKANNKADLRFDDDLRGFGVRVYPSGRKAFFISYRNATGTKKRYNFGNFGEFTATNARKMAQDLLADIRRGNDPQSDKQERRDEFTFEALANRYIEEYAKDHKRSWKDDAQRLRDHLLPVIGKRKLSEISLTQLQKLHSRIRKEKSAATANRVAALVKHVFTKAGEWKLVSNTPTTHLKMFKEPPPRDIALTPEQCRKLIDACDADENIFAAALFKLAMYTGRRVGELLGAKWTDVDLDKSILTLPQTKAGERQFVYLNEPAAAVLRTLPHIEGNKFVIAGNVPGKPLNFYRRAWNRILKRTDIDPFPPHGLRHNYASTLVAAGVPLETVGHLLGHKNTVTTRKYAHHRPDHLHRAADTFTDVIDFKNEKEKRGG